MKQTSDGRPLTSMMFLVGFLRYFKQTVPDLPVSFYMYC